MMEPVFVNGAIVGEQPTLDSIRRLAFTTAGSLDKLNCSDAFNLAHLTQMLDQKGIKYIVVGTAVAFEQALTVKKNDVLRYTCKGEWQEPTAEDYCAFYDKFLKI